MTLTKIKIKELVKGKKTYPNWTSMSTYCLNVEEGKEEILVYYSTKCNRKIKRAFPKEIKLTPRLSYVLGFLKGEGPNSLGKSNYRRFTITNSDPKTIKLVLKELDENKISKKSDIIQKSIHLLHYIEEDGKVIDYWSRELGLPKDRFKCFNDQNKTSSFGVCHVYISDVLLRRVIDLIHDEFLK